MLSQLCELNKTKNDKKKKKKRKQQFTKHFHKGIPQVPCLSAGNSLPISPQPSHLHPVFPKKELMFVSG